MEIIHLYILLIILILFSLVRNCTGLNLYISKKIKKIKLRFTSLSQSENISPSNISDISLDNNCKDDTLFDNNSNINNIKFKNIIKNTQNKDIIQTIIYYLILKIIEKIFNKTIIFLLLLDIYI